MRAPAGRKTDCRITREQFSDRFDREARASALLRSPYVVRVLDIDATNDGLPFIVMEYLEGHDIGSEIRSRGTIPLPEAVDWIVGRLRPHTIRE